MSTLTPNPERWLTPADIAREIGLHVYTVQKYIRTGQMPGKKLGNVYRVSVAEWEAYCEGRWQPRPTAPAPTSLVSRRTA